MNTSALQTAESSQAPHNDGNNESRRGGRFGDFSDVVIAAGVAAGMFSALIWFAISYQAGAYAPTFILTGIASGAGGWVVGIALSPYDTVEATMFSKISSAVYAFATGYLVSKFDPVITQAIQSGLKAGVNPVAARLAVFSIASFLASAALTYVSRAYWIERRKPNLREIPKVIGDAK